MGGFVYFVEEQRSSITMDRIAELGLAHAFEGMVESSEGLSGGPVDLGRGLFFSAYKRLGKGQRTGFYPEAQIWRRLPQIEGQPPRAIGHWKDDPPTPESLQRTRQLPGLLVTLPNGGDWQIPSVRSLDDTGQLWTCELPRHFDFDETGKLIPGRPQDKFAYLWELTAPLAAKLWGPEADDTEATDDEVALVVIELLKANYLVDVPELVQIDAFLDDGGQSFGMILSAACRKEALLRIIEDVKKNGSPETPTTSNTTDGNVVSRPVTRPAGAT